MNYSIATMLLQAGNPGFLGNPMIMMGLLFVVLYFFMIRPQQKKQKELKNMLGNLQKGDKVTTIGGIKGKVHRVTENSVFVIVDGTAKIEFTKSAIGSVDQQTNSKKDNEKVVEEVVEESEPSEAEK